MSNYRASARRRSAPILGRSNVQIFKPAVFFLKSHQEKISLHRPCAFRCRFEIITLQRPGRAHSVIRMEKGSIRITVLNHDAIFPKTLQSMLRQAGVSLEEFIEAL